VEPKEAWKIESRYAEFRGRKLLYVVNFENAPVRVKIEAPAGTFQSVKDLRRIGEEREGELTIAARQTAIYELH